MPDSLQCQDVAQRSEPGDLPLAGGCRKRAVTELFTGKPVRVLRSPQLDGIIQSMKEGLSFEDARSRIMEIRKKKRKKDPEFTSITSGQGAGLVHQISNAGEVIQEIMSEAESLYKKLNPWTIE